MSSTLAPLLLAWSAIKASSAERDEADSTGRRSRFSLIRTPVFAMGSSIISGIISLLVYHLPISTHHRCHGKCRFWLRFHRVAELPFSKFHENNFHIRLPRVRVVRSLQ